jgi:hypothetical protein
LYDQYDFRQPWNGPKNAALTEHRPDVFSCPDNCDNKKDTSYVAVTGHDTAWNENIVHKSAKLTNTSVLLVEVENSGICWMQPKDFDRASVDGKTGNISTIGVTSNDVSWTLIALTDGSVWRLPKDFPATELLKGITVGTVDKTDWHRLGARIVNPNDRMWGLLITRAAFPVWLLFVILFLYHARRSGIARIHAHSRGC